MYVLSAMPSNRQSMAGSLFQTLTRLVTAVGYGIATAIFDAVESKPAASGYYSHNAVEPYAAVWWFSAGVAALGILFVPWLKIGTQGHHGDEGRLVERGTGSEEGSEVVAQGGDEKEAKATDVETGC